MRIPITLITGFLGAGKSTLINRIIREHPDIRFGIVVNEFGDVNLESQIIDAPGSGIAELPNGCMCCVVRADLIGAVESLLQKDPKIRHIIIEASGLSDPVPIAATFLDHEARSHLFLDAIACVVDAQRFFDSLESFEIALQQILFSDLVLVSKASLASANSLENLSATLKSLRPKGRIFIMDESFSTDLLIDPVGGDHGDIRNLTIVEHDHDAHHSAVHNHETHEQDGGAEGKNIYRHKHEEVDIVFITAEEKLNVDRFGAFLNTLPTGLARAKGFVHFEGPKVDNAKYLIQVVGQRPSITRREWGEDEKRQCAMVFIGRGLDSDDLRRSFYRTIS